MGLGAICHTLNPRLSDTDITYIAGGGGVWPQPACTQGRLLHTTASGVCGSTPVSPTACMWWALPRLLQQQSGCAARIATDNQEESEHALDRITAGAGPELRRGVLCRAVLPRPW